MERIEQSAWRQREDFVPGLGDADRVLRLRRERRYVEKLRELEALGGGDESDEAMGAIPDDRLRLFFTCCHPALAPEARVALTLRSLGGLSTPEVARALIVWVQASMARPPVGQSS